MRIATLKGHCLLLAVATLFHGVPGTAQNPELGASETESAFHDADIRGRNLRYKCIGEGSPTVVVERGLGGTPLEIVFSQEPSTGWAAIASEVRKVTRCVYDRAGAGRSDSAPTRRTSFDVAFDLAALLKAADIRPPYILAGRSFVGLNARVFASRYPELVAGNAANTAWPKQARQSHDQVDEEGG
jgi:hypothetical protein